MVELPKCECGCGETLARTGRSGPAPRYSSVACRKRASRKRLAPSFESFPGLVAPQPIQVISQKIDDQIAQALLQTRSVGFALQRLGREARPELGWRCTKLGDHIVAGLLELFPDPERQPNDHPES